MTRLLPKSLFGQMLLILLAGLTVSNLIAAWIYSSDREAAVREVGGWAAAAHRQSYATGAGGPGGVARTDR